MTEEKRNEKAKEDLSDLLNGALNDFESITHKKKVSKTKKVQSSTLPTENDLLAMFTASNNDGAGVKEELEKLSKMSSEESNAMIQAKLTETLSQMQVNSQASSKTSLEDNLFQNIPGLTGGDSFDNLLPMMEGMMQSLLSKELLYTPMKDIADKFPDWLADNRNGGSEEEFIKYNKQFELTKKICFLYEEEKDSDTSEKKKKRFDKVMALMQEMQNLGHPPKELVGESPSPMDPAAFPPGMDLNSCPLQ
mgnify:CR=1 FL=1